MTTFPDQNDDARFDRLADGELSTDEYRQLLGALDDEPGGWKRCALAFLEAQAWGGDLAALQQEAAQPVPAPAPAAKPAVPAGTPLSARWRYPLVALAMAMSFLVAFGLGLAARTSWMSSSGPGGEIVAVDPPANNNSKNSPRENAREEQLAGDTDTKPLGNVQLVVEGNGHGQPEQQVNLPVYHIRHGGENYLNGNVSALPPEVQQMLERRGYFHRERTFVPLQLEDGRQVLVPVEEIELVPRPRPPL